LRAGQRQAPLARTQRCSRTCLPVSARGAVLQSDCRAEIEGLQSETTRIQLEIREMALMTLKTVETTRIGTFFRGHVLILYGHVLGQGWDMLCPVLANPPKTKGRVPALRLPGQPPKTHPRTLQRPTRMRLACLGACIVISPEAIKVPSGPWNHRSPRGDGDVKTVAALNVMEIAPFRMMDRWCSDMLDLVPRTRLHRKNLGVINKPTAIVRSRPAPGFEQPSCRVLGQALGDL